MANIPMFIQWCPAIYNGKNLQILKFKDQRRLIRGSLAYLLRHNRDSNTTPTSLPLSVRLFRLHCLPGFLRKFFRDQYSHLSQTIHCQAEYPACAFVLQKHGDPLALQVRFQYTGTHFTLNCCYFYKAFMFRHHAALFLSPAGKYFMSTRLIKSAHQALPVTIKLIYCKETSPAPGV